MSNRWRKFINQSNHQCSCFPRLQKGFYTNANKIMSLCRWWRPSPLIIIQICLFFFSLSLNYHMHNSLKGPNTSSVMISCHVKIFHCHSRDERERCELVSINHTWMWNWGLVFIYFFFVFRVPFLHSVREDGAKTILMWQIHFECENQFETGLNKSPIHP